ncbi:MAG: ribonuclease HII [Patescibacteria group bacterium]
MTYPNRQLENKLAKKYQRIAGVDEAGRGALAGPIVAGAVIMPRKRILGIKDSKLLSPQKRQILFKEIKKEAIAWAIGSVSNKQIDKIGIGRANKLAIQKAIGKLNPRPDYVLIDGNLKIDSKLPYRSIIDGDYKIYVIAAASILAKVYRDNLLVSYHRKYPKYQLSSHKGYGTKTHLVQLKKLGPSQLHRLSFLSGLLKR